MQHTKLFIATAFFGALTCSGLNAQTTMRADIPFEFQAGDRTFPAGYYTIREEGAWVILREGEKPTVAVAVMTNSASAGRISAAFPRVEFHRYGNSYFLASVWDGFSGEGRQILPTSHERGLIKLAQRRNDLARGTVAIASR